MRFNIRLESVKTRTELANELGVDVKALDLVILNSDVTCTTNGCSLPSTQSNHNRCILCQQSWYPREKNGSGKPLNNRRGFGLYGKQYMCRYNGMKAKACCCESPLCEEIGYSHEGMFCPPTNSNELKDAIWVLGIRSPEKRDKILNTPRNYQISPWHYNRRHRRKGDDGNWELLTMEKYRDNDGKCFSYPPPNANVQNYIDNEINGARQHSRGSYDDMLPRWVHTLSQLQKATTPTTATPARINTNSSSSKMRRVDASSVTPSPRPPRKRASPESEEITELKDTVKLLQIKLDSAFAHIQNMEAKVDLLGQENIQIRIENTALKEENAHLKAVIEKLEQQKVVISYDDLREGGRLADFVNDFTFFNNFKANDAFLDAINYTDICGEGNGICEHMKRYSKVSMEERKKYNNMTDGGNTEGVTQQQATSDDMSVSDDDMSVSDDAGAGLSAIAEEAMAEEEMLDAEPSKKRPGPQRKLHWKTEWLVYCFYARGNISMRRTAALFGIGPTLVHNIVYAWANVLCDILAEIFPVPTRSQMLRAYPESMIRSFGHARTFMLLDATEAFADVASMKTVNAVLYSAYKHNSTMKWLVGCCPIGTTWNESISDGYPGSISDPVATAVSGILQHIPYGWALEVDKGFLIDNTCATLGLYLIRPQKMLDNQTQQCKEDVALTQKVGKTRIVIEQANGQMKRSTGFFDRRIRIDQIGLADKIFRASFLLQNFKLPFIQDRDVKEDDKVRRPCKAEIRYYGGTDDGLVDIRGEIELWGVQDEIIQWNVLRNNPRYASYSDIDISEMVLEMDIISKLKREHIAEYESLLGL